MQTLRFIITTLFFIGSSSAIAIDIVRFAKPESNIDTLIAYKVDLVTKALEATQTEYGSFLVKVDAPSMKKGRAIETIKTGNIANVGIGPLDKEWIEKTIVIPIPLRGGTLSYRLLLIHKDNLAKFKKITTIDELKNLKSGVLKEWKTTQILTKHHFTTIEGNTHDGLFLMLENRRFDYVLRGIHEVFDEIEKRKVGLPNVVIEPNLALHIPTYTYLAVSPAQPKLAERLHKGLKIISKNNTLKALFDAYYLDSIKKSGLKNRRILRLNIKDTQQSKALLPEAFNNENLIYENLIETQ